MHGLAHRPRGFLDGGDAVGDQGAEEALRGQERLISSVSESISRASGFCSFSALALETWQLDAHHENSISSSSKRRSLLKSVVQSLDADIIMDTIPNRSDPPIPNRC